MLTKWVLGMVPEHQAEGIVDHLDHCASCDDFVSRVELPQLNPKNHLSGGFLREPECKEMVDRLSVPQNPSTQPPTSQDLSGTSIRDYFLIRLLGRGGMGTVYLARHTRLNRLVAVKLVPEHSNDDPTAVARFEREMQAVGLFDHPNIVTAFDAGDVDGLYFLTMEFVDGVNLSRLARIRTDLSIADSCEIIREAAGGMQYAHDQGLIHRDVKPSNLMIGRDKDGRVRTKVLDLGLALLPDADTSEVPITDPEFLVGTLEYMAPEQSEGIDGVDHLADIYSLGATLFRLLTGSLPFHGPEYQKPVHRLMALNTTNAPGVSTVCPDIPDRLAKLVDDMLSRDRSIRPQSMAEVAETLAPFCTGSDLKALLADVPAVMLDNDATQRSDSLKSPVMALADTSPTAVPTIVDPVASRRPTQPDDATPRKRNGKWTALAMIIPLVILFTIIWVKTDTGYVRLEFDDGIAVALELLRNGERVEDWQMSQSRQKFSLRTGKYEIRLPVGTDDAIQIKNNRFYLKRNGQQVVKIEHVTELRKSATADTTLVETIITPGWNWGGPVHLGNDINSEWKDDQPTISADGLTMIFGSFCIPRFAGEGDRDLWVTTRDDLHSPWKPVSNLGAVVNSSGKESHPSLHSESGCLVFASKRGGGVGNTDLWYSTRDQESNAWTPPVNLGPNVNSQDVDDNPEISSDGLSLYFASTRGGGAGESDLWLCRRDSIDDRWGTAERLPESINTKFQDSEPALSADQLTLIFTSDRPGGIGSKDLWALTRPTVKAPWGVPGNLGPAVNTPGDDVHAAFLPDGRSLVFGSTREGGLGGTDLWTVNRIDVVEPAAAPTASLSDGLMWMWLFDAVEEGVIRDHSGNGHHGKLISENAELAFVAGAPLFGKQAMHMHGTDHVVHAQHHEKLSFSDQMSLSLWFRGVQLPDSMSERIIQKASKTDGFSLSVSGMQSRNPGRVVFNTMKRGASGAAAKSGTDVCDGAWHHIAGTFDGTKLNIYVDGRLENTRTPGHAIGFNEKTLEIGSDTSLGLTADIDEVCIYDRSLLGSEVVALTKSRPIAKNDLP